MPTTGMTRLIRVEHPAPGHDGVALVTIDRPEARNALSFAILEELAESLEMLDGDPTCRVVVLTGAGDRAFAAGADIVELADQTPERLEHEGQFEAWDRLAAVGLPLIAAVRGYALGGGCELAMTCDLIVAGDDARFGQPEIKIGVMPGAGGTQRLTRAVGKYRAMEIILTGRFVKAEEAKAIGLVAQVYPAASWLDDAKALARTIAEKPPIAVRLATEAIDLAFNSTLDAGLEFERKAFYLLFSTEDKQEGVDAFVNKRKAVFKGR